MASTTPSPVVAFFTADGAASHEDVLGFSAALLGCVALRGEASAAAVVDFLSDASALDHRDALHVRETIAFLQRLRQRAPEAFWSALDRALVAATDHLNAAVAREVRS